MLSKIILFLLGSPLLHGVQCNVDYSPGIKVLTWNVQPERERAYKLEPVDEERAGFATNYKAALDFIEHQAEKPGFDFFGFQAGHLDRSHLNDLFLPKIGLTVNIYYIHYLLYS